MSLPHWRYVDYTDDGCSIYECLNCYQQWEGRTSPGWFDSYEDIPEPTSDSYSSQSDDGTIRYWRKRDEPIYKPVWTFCPYCGIQWKGPIRCLDDNERMLGARRRNTEDLIRQRQKVDGWATAKPPTWWWWLEERTVWPDRDEPEKWEVKYKMDPRKVNAVRAYEILKQHRSELNNRESLFGTWEEARLTKKPQSELEKLPWKPSVYERH